MRLALEHPFSPAIVGATLLPPTLTMLRWVLTIFLTVMILSSALPWLKKFGLGRLPGDLNFRLFGREFMLPFASTILLSLVAVMIGKLL